MVEVETYLEYMLRVLIIEKRWSRKCFKSVTVSCRRLTELAKGRTTLVIAHRLATIQNADRIVVVDETGIVEEGCHQELVLTAGLYQRLHAAQFATLTTV